MSAGRLLKHFGPEIVKALAPASVLLNSVSMLLSSRVDRWWAIFRVDNATPFEHESLFWIFKYFYGFAKLQSFMDIQPPTFPRNRRHVITHSKVPIMCYFCGEFYAALNVREEYVNERRVYSRQPRLPTKHCGCTKHPTRTRRIYWTTIL